jgi:S-adenosyl methyltransferase
VDNDPIVLNHARALLTSSPEGATAYIDADLRDAGPILERAFAGLDLVEPGLVQVHRWRPGAGDVGSGRDLAIYAGVGRKP